MHRYLQTNNRVSAWIKRNICIFAKVVKARNLVSVVLTDSTVLLLIILFTTTPGVPIIKKKKRKKKNGSKIVSSTRSPTCPNRTIIELSLSSLLWAWNPNARGSKFCASKRDLSEWRCKPATLSARASWSALVPRWHGHECLPAHVQAHVHAYFRTDCLQRDNKPTRVRTRDERMDAADPSTAVGIMNLIIPMYLLYLGTILSGALDIAILLHPNAMD